MCMLIQILIMMKIYYHRASHIEHKSRWIWKIAESFVMPITWICVSKPPKKNFSFQFISFISCDSIVNRIQVIDIQCSMHTHNLNSLESLNLLLFYYYKITLWKQIKHVRHAFLFLKFFHFSIVVLSCLQSEKFHEQFIWCTYFIRYKRTGVWTTNETLNILFKWIYQRSVTPLTILNH